MTLYSLCLPDYMELAVSLLDLTGYCASFRIPCLTALVPQILPGVPHSSPTQGWLGVESATVSLVPQSGGKACDFATRSMQVSPSVGATPQNALGQDSLRSWSLLFLPQRAHRFGMGGISCWKWKWGCEISSLLSAVSYPIVLRQASSLVQG